MHHARSPLRRLALCALLLGSVAACEGESVAETRAPPTSAPPRSEVPTAPTGASDDVVSDDATGGTATREDVAPPGPAVPVPSPTPTYGHADLDPNNDARLGPPPEMGDCEEKLEAAGVTFKAARIGVGRKRDGVYTCGAHQVVRFRKGPGEITYSSSPLLSCPMAIALADFERVLQEEAERHLGSRVAKIEHLGTYNCREMANYDLISEHSYANAIDLRRFHLADGRTVDVLDDFHPEVVTTADPKSLFLRAVSNRLYDENVFSNVITPYFDQIHRNHIHVDLARYRVDGSRP